MSKLFMMAGTKGGIGKSLVATLLADLSFDNRFRPVLFDCDDENRTLSNAYDENDREILLHRIDMTGRGRKVFPLDTVVDQMVEIEQDKKRHPGDNAFILDMKAGTSAGTMEWLRAFPFPELRQLGIEAHIVGVVTAELDSCTTLLPWLHAYLKTDMLAAVRFVVIRNEVAGTEFEFFDTKIREILAIADVPCLVLRLGDWGSKYQIPLQRNHASYGRIAAGRARVEEFGFMDEYRIKHYYREAGREFGPLFERPPAEPEKSSSIPKLRGDK